MTTRPETKLAELRSKTDRQLLQLVARQLDRARTPRACEEIRRLLPYLPHPDRRRIEQRLEELGERFPAPLHAGCC